MNLFFKNYKSIFNYFHKNTNNKNIILCGGNTIKKVLFYLSKNFNLKKNRILLSDERLVKENSKFRNDIYYKKLILRNLISKKKFIFYKKSAIDKLYLDKFIKTVELNKFQTCLLSLGVNAHLAGIFNFNDKLERSYYYSESKKKKPKDRVTISSNKISNCKKIFILVSKKRFKTDLNKFKKINFFKKNKKKIFFLILRNQYKNI